MYRRQAKISEKEMRSERVDREIPPPFFNPCPVLQGVVEIRNDLNSQLNIREPNFYLSQGWMQGIVPMVNVPFQHNFELFRDPVNCLMTVVPRNEGPFVILPIPSQMRISSVNSMCQSLNDRTQIQVFTPVESEIMSCPIQGRRNSIKSEIYEPSDLQSDLKLVQIEQKLLTNFSKAALEVEEKLVKKAVQENFDDLSLNRGPLVERINAVTNELGQKGEELILFQNQRIISHKQKKTRNSESRGTKYRGVSKNGSKYQVFIMINKKKRYYGVMQDQQHAAVLYDKLTIIFQGLKGKTNFSYSVKEVKEILMTADSLIKSQ